MLSTVSRSMRDSGYFEVPAARGARAYPTWLLGKASAGTTSRSTWWCGGSEVTASTVARLISR